MEEIVAFRVLAAGQTPSHRSLCRFRQQHIAEFLALFVQVVEIAMASGLAKLGTIAIDGTKNKADASKRKAMSYGRMKMVEKRLRKEIKALIKAAGDVDALEDEQFGPDFRGDEMPEELRRRESRLKVIRDSKKRLEDRKREEDAEKVEAEREQKNSTKKRGPKRKHPLWKPKDSDQENFTDPDGRIMKNGSGAFEQCYNAQTAVDGGSQIIVAAGVTQCAADCKLLIPLLDATILTQGAYPSLISAKESEETRKSPFAGSVGGRMDECPQ